MIPVNLLASACVLLTENGPPLVIPPSGTVAVVSEPKSSKLKTSWSTDDTGLNHTDYVTVWMPNDKPELLNAPTEPGEYIVSAQFVAAWKDSYQNMPDGVTLYTPALLIFPGQPGHPGDNVKGPVAPGLVMRYSGASRRWM